VHRSAALPFQLSRSEDAITGMEVTTTRETVHGLLRLDGERITVQWRVARSMERVGSEIRTDREMEPVREVTLPLSGIASARVSRHWHSWITGPRLLLTASDLRAFEEIAGSAGLRLAHPARIALRIRRGDWLEAREFAAELEMALADRALAAAEGAGRLKPPPTTAGETVPDRST
jgi:hypothetical protein